MNTTHSAFTAEITEMFDLVDAIAALRTEADRIRQTLTAATEAGEIDRIAAKLTAVNMERRDLIKALNESVLD